MPFWSYPMSSVTDIAQMRPRVDAHRFLHLLATLAKRVESGNTSSISVGECRSWGFDTHEVVPYLLLLVEVGIVEQRVQVYDASDDAFEDYSGQADLDSLDSSRVKFWFRPTLTGAEFSSFFVPP